MKQATMQMYAICMVACALLLSFSYSDNAEVYLVLDKQLLQSHYYGKTLLQFALQGHIKPLN